MYHQQVSKKTSPPQTSMTVNQDVAPSPTYGSLSSVVHRAQQDANSVSEDERQQLESAIGTRSTKGILAGQQGLWIPEFKGISAQVWGDAGQGGVPIQAKRKDEISVSEVRSENKTGLPDNLKAGVENLSGYSLDNVKVHYNSSKPSELQALAYTQGTDIHVAPGQEKHLPHEAWHVVQQMQGRVKPTIQAKGIDINNDEGLETEADVMGEKAEYAEGKLIDHDLTHVVQQAPTKLQSKFLHSTLHKPEVIQRYTLFNAGVAAGQYQQNVANVFSSQVKNLVDVGFLNPVTGQPRINNTIAPPVRISQNGLLAVEDANLLNKQPKHFYAAPGQIAAWNETLTAKGSYIRLLTDPGMTLTFTLLLDPAPKTLVKVFAHNIVKNNQGNNMTIAQQCDSTIKEVIGTHYQPKNSFLNLPGIVVPPGPSQSLQEGSLKQYYIAAELAHIAGVGGVNGGMPVGGLSTNNPVVMGQQNINIAHNYGSAMYAHSMAPNAALDGRMQHLGVNQYAVPNVGEGLVTNSLGGNQTLPGPVHIREDKYNNRNIANPSNQNMWGFHWGGVVAKDGADYITLENYARNAEDGMKGEDSLFYFQMYGAGVQSWHEVWAAIGGGGREFSNPLTMKVVSDENPNANAGWNQKAQRAFGSNVNGVKDDYGTVAGATSTDALTVALLKGLAYANERINNGYGFGRWNRITNWRIAVNGAAANANATLQTNALATYVAQQLNRLKRNPFKR